MVHFVNRFKPILMGYKILQHIECWTGTQPAREISLRTEPEPSLCLRQFRALLYSNWLVVCLVDREAATQSPHGSSETFRKES
jgi:hypothetical protein